MNSFVNADSKLFCCEGWKTAGSLVRAKSETFHHMKVPSIFFFLRLDEILNVTMKCTKKTAAYQRLKKFQIILTSLQ